MTDEDRRLLDMAGLVSHVAQATHEVISAGRQVVS